MSSLKRVIFYDGAVPSRKYAALHWALNLLLLLLWCAAVGLFGLWFGKSRYGPELFDSYLQSPPLLALNLLPVLAAALLLFLLTNRMWPGVLASGLLTVTLAYINHFKLLARDEPLLASDAAYFFEAAKIADNYNVTVTPAMALAYAAVLAAAVFAFFLMRARFRRALPRIVTAALVLAACAGLYFGAYANEGLYEATENLDVEFAGGRQLGRWNVSDQFASRGFLYPLLHSAAQPGDVRPKGYDSEKARALLAEYSDADIPAGQKVNLISVMLEAYCDFSVYGDLFDFTTDPYEFYHALEAESVSGPLVTNIFGGGTINTERCYITGSMDMYDYTAPAWSYARWFNGQGYDTEFCHAGYAWYYNRQNVEERLGFQRRWFFENRFTLPEGYGLMRDDQFFPELAALYDEGVARGTPYFNFSVTYQNHGPYAADYLYDTETEYLARGSLSDESYHILNNYFWGIHLTDGALRDFVDRLRDSSEPVVLVLFGDHKPWMGDDSSVYTELGIDVITCATDESFYDRYCTQYLIWANGAAKEVLGNDFTGEGPSLSPGFLMMEVLDLCGWEGPAYAQAERELFETVDVVSSFGLFRENGALTDSLSAASVSPMYKVWYLQYYLAHEWGA